MKTFLVLIDSLNRHYLQCYNPQTWVIANNLNQFAHDNVVFDRHYIGSAPCMPTRRDIFTGRLNFLERNWGPIEPYDITLIAKLREHGIYTHMTTDHPHYFEIGGENYCQMFNTWNYERGQEGDAWISKVDGVLLPGKHFGKLQTQNYLNRQAYISEADHPTPRTFQSACDWVINNRDADNYFMMVEAFDPHEPFDCVEEYAQLYHDDYDGPSFDWPSYELLQDETEAAMEHLRKRYAGTLTQMDQWFGKFIKTLKDEGIYDESLIIVTTDHGHMLGEHGYAAKGFMPVYNELAHIPFMIHLPGSEMAGKRINALTQNIDLMPTILSYFKIDTPETVLGTNLIPVMQKDTPTRDSIIYGWFGKAVNVTDGRYTYFRAPVSEDNQPCYLYGAMPTTFLRYWEGDPQDYELGSFLPFTQHPVYKVRFHVRGHYPECPDGIDYIRESLLFDLENDPLQNDPLTDPALEKKMIESLKECMTRFGSPREQYERLGI